MRGIVRTIGIVTVREAILVVVDAVVADFRRYVRPADLERTLAESRDDGQAFPGDVVLDRLPTTDEAALVEEAGVVRWLEVSSRAAVVR